jgi:hypothetical protein
MISGARTGASRGVSKRARSRKKGSRSEGQAADDQALAVASGAGQGGLGGDVRDDGRLEFQVQAQPRFTRADLENLRR